MSSHSIVTRALLHSNCAHTTPQEHDKVARRTWFWRAGMAQTADYRLGDHTFARGWHMVADASQLGKEPMPLRFFARDMVLYRGESGQPHLVDAYCPHMGAHLGRNETSYIVRDNERIQG